MKPIELKIKKFLRKSKASLSSRQCSIPESHLSNVGSAASLKKVKRDAMTKGHKTKAVVNGGHRKLSQAAPMISPEHGANKMKTVYS